MKIIIPMAGEGARFKNIGIDKPKHEIIANSKTLFEWSLLSLQDFFKDEFIFIVRKEAYNNEFIVKTCNELKINNIHIIEIDAITDGQATTCFYADKFIKDDDSIIIYNIDTYIETGELRREHIKNEYDGFIPVFIGTGDRWSFIKVDSTGKVTDITEKKRISDLCSIGFYYFKSWKKYKEIYHQHKKDIIYLYNEAYIAPMYKYLLEQYAYIGYTIIPSDRTHILGTPEDVKFFDLNFEKNN